MACGGGGGGVCQGGQLEGGLFNKGSQGGLMLSPQSKFEVWDCWWMCMASRTFLFQ